MEVERSNSDKIILHLCACEFGSDSKPYRDAGYDVRSITKDIGVENYHPPENVYGIIANPPCTKFSRAAWQIKKADRDFKEGMRLVKECLRIIWEVQENGATKLLGARESRWIPHTIPRLPALFLSTMAILGNRLQSNEKDNALGIFQSANQDNSRTHVTTCFASLPPRGRWKR
jgi:hypothetical protein